MNFKSCDPCESGRKTRKCGAREAAIRLSSRLSRDWGPQRDRSGGISGPQMGCSLDRVDRSIRRAMLACFVLSAVRVLVGFIMPPVARTTGQASARSTESQLSGAGARDLPILPDASEG